MTQNNKSERLRRAESALTPKRDSKQSQQYEFAKRFALLNPALHSGTPEQRAAAEQNVASVLANEMARRLDMSQIQDPKVRALKGTLEFYARRETPPEDSTSEDWE